ncbi:serine/threonine-protein kinase [Streptomyces coerulescens]|uniref:non-specific serine/threonine protein kinase n=1 Tax=Streptomyces coerulescens TaxID=29304 RepID=A0ABW0CTX9_STRCD
MARDASLFSGRPSELIGRQVAGYRIEREIGRGGMAVVYRARDLRLERTVALKLLAPELARNDTFRRRFTHESRAAAAIDHPHIVPVFEAGETDGVLYIAMRYVAGSDLRHLLDRQGPLPSGTALRIAAQVASALDAAHEHGLVHRDVKPGNILVARGTDSDHPEHVYLTDFGLTKKSLSLTGFTTVGQFVGTLDYVAPEQISGKPVDARCDVYGFACVVYECLAGHPPFRRDDDMALLWAHQYDEPPPVTEARPDLAAPVDAVFAGALAKSPDQRQDSCLAFVAELRDAVAGGTGAGHAPTEVDLRVAGVRVEPAEAGHSEGRGVTGPAKEPVESGPSDSREGAASSQEPAAPAPPRDSARSEPKPPPRWAEPVFRR